ncbi:MAG: FecR domain-containing protein [Saprospiraceae bacterium]|nr:FecR domain-containing protein [Saprospiraceae bacterium]
MSHAELLLLLQRQWADEIAPEELERLEACLRESPQWAAEAEAYRQIWQNATPPPTKAIEMDLDREFEQLMARIAASDSAFIAELPQAHKWRLAWWKAAAAAAVAIMVGVALFWLVRPSASTVHEEYAQTGHRELRLPDGSLVSLRQGSKLRYDAETYNRYERRVELEGEAVFTVEHNAQKPFVVETSADAVAEVLGTQFDLRTQGNETSVLVCEGIVRFWPQGKGHGKQSTILQAKEKARWHATGQRLEKDAVPNLNELVWQTHRLSFSGEPLSEVVAEFEAYFQVDIEIEAASMHSCTHGGNYQLDDLGLERSLENLCRAYDLRLRKKDDTHYLLAGGKCSSR